MTKRDIIPIAIVVVLCIGYAVVSDAQVAPVPTPPSTTAASAPASASPSPSPIPPSYVPSPEQLKDLRIAQLDALLANTRYQARAQQLPEYMAWIEAAKRLPEFTEQQSAVGKFFQVCIMVRDANKWPKDVGCDIGQNPVVFAAVGGQGSGSGSGTKVGTPAKTN